MSLSHKQARQWIEKAADGLLNADQQAALNEHLKGCAVCRAFAAELTALESALGAALSERWGKPKLSKSGEQNLVKSLQETYGPGGGNGGLQGGLLEKWPWLLIIGIGVLAAFLLAGLFNPPASAIETPTDTNTPEPTETSTATPSTMHTSIPTPSSAPLILIAIPIQNANCRDGASNTFIIADTLFEGEGYTPIGRGFDNLWVQFVAPVNLTKCWAFIENLDLLIDGVLTPIEEIAESLLPYVAYPPTPTPSSTPTRTPTPVRPQCSDGIDNDRDGAIDYPKDKDCESPGDNNEWD
jgi:hypothetical protein